MKVDTVVKKDVLLILVMIVVVPLAGELKYYPFHDTYRVSFAVPIFLFTAAFKKGISCNTRYFSCECYSGLSNVP